GGCGGGEAVVRGGGKKGGGGGGARRREWRGLPASRLLCRRGGLLANPPSIPRLTATGGCTKSSRSGAGSAGMAELAPLFFLPSTIPPNEIVISWIVPTTAEGLQDSAHHLVDLLFDEAVYLSRPGIDRGDGLLLPVKGL